MTPSSFPYNDVGMHQHHYQQPHDGGLHQEWNKIRVERQKLALLQQRLELEEEMLKNEKRNFRRNSKLKKHAARDDQSIGSSSAKIHDSPEATKTTVDENNLLVLELREQLKEAEEKLKTQQSFQDELQNVHAQLAATQRSLTLTILEKDTILQERNDLHNRLKNQPVVRQTSINRCEKCDQQQIKLQRLQDELESLRLKCKDHEVEKEEVRANFVAEMEKLRDEISELRQEKEALESELQSSREVDSERLQDQLIEQSKQLDDCKLMISRGKVLLEDANAKSDRLQTRCADLESKNEEQQELLDNLQSNKAELEKKHEKLEQEYRSLKEQHGIQQLQSSNHSIVSDLSDEGEGTGTLTGNSTQSNSPIIIPLDDGPVSSKLVRSGMKHVVEWEWTNRKGVLGLFTGWLDLPGNPNGHGTWRIEDGSIYDGEWKRGLRNGHGVYTSIDGDLYRGFWLNDVQHGRGVYVWPDGQMFTGDYVHGIREGKGIETWPSGARFEGEYRDDRRNGQGSYWYADGRCYQGEYQDDKPVGEGRRKSSDGSIVTIEDWNAGEFING